MHGDGTKPAITTPDMAQARLLDLTRSMRRAGRVATGIDRVELAYLKRFLQDDNPVFGLVRTPFGYLLLDRAGMSEFSDKLQDAIPWGQADFWSSVWPGRDPVVRQAESDLRHRAVDRATRPRLRAMLARNLQKGYAYFNIGHSNLTERVLRSVKQSGGQVHALVHDVIPLEYPGYQRPGTVVPFRIKMQLLRGYADRLIYNSQDTQKRCEEQMLAWGVIPPGVVAHLGVENVQPDPAAVPSTALPDCPYFICVGTIEPRKNHAFLLDLWDRMGTEAPPLLICGARGWNNEAVFKRLDQMRPFGVVRELSGLPDAALSALVQGASGLLFPSHAEGFGLPPLEAAQLGTRVLCNDLPVLREILGDWAHFIPVSEPDLWVRNIKKWEKIQPNAKIRDGIPGPTWNDHFKTVLRLN